MYALVPYTYSTNDDPILLWLIYVYNSVIQILWFVNLLIRQVSKCITVGSSEPALSMVEVQCSTSKESTIVLRTKWLLSGTNLMYREIYIVEHLTYGQK